MPLSPDSYTPGGWLAYLNAKLDVQAAAVKAPIRYFDGQHKLSFATAKFKEAFSRFFPPIADNWMQLVVNAPVERLEVQGFRFNPDPSQMPWDAESDQEAWEMWQANNMDAVSVMAFTEAVKCGVAYFLVTPQPDQEWPLITVELPEQCYVETDPANPRVRLQAIKRWRDEDGYLYAYVYGPDYVQRWRSVEKADKYVSGEDIQWKRPPGADPVSVNPLGVVPMVALENRPDPRHGGRSDLEPAMPIQDAVNKLCLDMLVSSEFHAYPQRWASGWEGAVDKDGNAITNLDMVLGQSRLVRAQAPDAKFGQWNPGNVDNYIRPVEMYLDHLAAVTQTPAYYLKGEMANLSAEAIMAADTGLVRRVDRKHLSFEDGLEETMRVGFLAKGDTAKAKAVTAETIWKDAEPKSLGALVDAALKLRTGLSAPLEMCWQMIGWSPQQIRQAKSMMNLPDSPSAATPGENPNALNPSAANGDTVRVVLPNGVTPGGQS